MSFLFKIPIDKFLHFIAGYLLACAGLYWGFTISLILVATFGVGKKLVDYHVEKLAGKTPDMSEMIWDIVATFLGAAPIWALHFLHR